MKKFKLILCVIFFTAAALSLAGAASAAMSDEEFLELCMNGTREEVASAIKAGANMNAADEDNWTVLHCAALGNENPSVLEILIENGANVNAKDNGGNTPLILAVAGGKPKNILLLLDRGADAGIPDNEGNTVREYLPDSTDGVDENEWKAVMERLKNP